MNTRVIISAEDQTSAGINSVKTSLNGLGSAAAMLTPLLQGFASALSISAFVTFVKGSIDAADAMKDLSERTSLSIQELATWELAAKQSGSSLNSVALGIKGLSQFMVKHTNELQAAGITATTTNGAMLQLADLFQALPDGATKSALAVKIFARAGEALIPMLNQGSKGLAETNEKSAEYAKRLAELAPLADKFNDQMSELGLHTKTTGINIAQVFMPGLIGMTKWLGDFQQGGERGATAMEYLTEKTEKFTDLIPQLRVMAALIAGIGPALALAGVGGDEKKRSASGLIAGGPGDIAAKLQAEMELGERNVAGMKAADLLGNNKPRANRAAKVSEYERLTKSISEKTAALQASTEGEDKATEAQKLALKLMVDIRDGTLKLTVTEKQKLAIDLEALLTQDARAVAHAKWLKQLEAEDKARADSLKATIADTVALEKKVAETEREVEEIGLTAEQLTLLKIARMDAAIAAKEQELAGVRLNSTSAAEIELIEDQVAALRKLRDLEGSRLIRNAMAEEAKRARQVWEKFSDDISRSLTDALMRGFEDGKPFAENFLDSLQATFKTAVLKIAVQMVMDPISGSLKGILGGTSGATGLFGNSGSITDTLSAGGSLYNLFTGNVGGGLYGAFAGSSVGASLGLSVPGLMGPTTSGAALSGLTGLGTALPYVGMALAAASMLGLFEGDGPTERSASVHQWGNVNGYAGEYGHNSAIGGFTPWANNQWFSGDMWGSQKAFGDELVAIDNKVAAAITPAQLAAVQAALQADTPTSVGFGTEHTDWRQSGADEFIMTERYQIILNALQAGLGDLAAQGGITADEVLNLVEGLGAAEKAVKAAENSQLAAQKTIAEGWQRVADSIVGTMRKLRGELGGPQSSFAQAQADFLIGTAAARAGDQDAAGKLPALAQAVVELGRAVSVTSVDQAMLTARTIASLQGTVQGMARFGITVPAFAEGGYHAGGWRRVGERGPELEFTGPSRIFSAGQSQGLLGGNTELLAEIRELRNEVAGLRAAATSSANSARQTSTLLQRVTRDGNSLLTTPA